MLMRNPPPLWHKLSIADVYNESVVKVFNLLNAVTRKTKISFLRGPKPGVTTLYTAIVKAGCVEPLSIQSIVNDCTRCWQGS